MKLNIISEVCGKLVIIIIFILLYRAIVIEQAHQSFDSISF